MTDPLPIIDLMKVPGGHHPAVYVLGSFAGRVTIADQQRRALNLYHALHSENRISEAHLIAVIGGGIAGTTFAASAKDGGYQVHIFDSNAQVLSLQEGSSRWIHPNIYDWPEANWRNRHTAFPVMNWEAGTASEVMRSLRGQWNETHAGNITFHERQTIEEIRRTGEKWELRSATKTFSDYDVVILAVGFGEEDNFANFACPGYWKENDLHQRFPKGGSVFISGCGDGGLTECMRVLITDFDHAWLHQIANGTDLLSTKQRLVQIERNDVKYQDGASLTEEYESLTALWNPTIALVRQRLRPHTQVLMNGISSGLFSRKSCVLNRVVVSILRACGAVEYVSASIDVRDVKRSPTTLQYEVPLPSGLRGFDQVVVRHGPKSALDAFVEIADRLSIAKAYYQTYRAAVDLTRRSTWESFRPPLPNPAIGMSHKPMLRTFGDSLRKHLICNGCSQVEISLDIENSMIVGFRQSGVLKTYRVDLTVHGTHGELRIHGEIDAFAELRHGAPDFAGAVAAFVSRNGSSL